MIFYFIVLIACFVVVAIGAYLIGHVQGEIDFQKRNYIRRPNK